MKYAPRLVLVDVDKWKLVSDFKVESGGWTLVVPRGFVSDLASIPRWLWPIVSPVELGIAGPLVHDWLYEHAGGIAIGSQACPPEGPYPSWEFTREEADIFLWDIMKQDNVWWWRRWIAYQAVRLFGASNWG